jgi:SPOR domain
MARTPAAANGGWPAPRHPAEPDPRNGRAAPQGQRPMQQPQGYPQGYPEQQGGAPGYDPQMAYHYPQNGQPAPQPNPRQGLSSLEPAGQSEFAPYPAGQSPYAQPQQPAYGQPQPASHTGYRPAPAPYAPVHQQDDQRAAAAAYEQWQAGGLAQDPRGYDLGSYMPTGAQHSGGLPLHAEPVHHDPLMQQSEWGAGAHLGYGEGGVSRDPYGNGQMGYEPLHGGALEQSYAQEEIAEYEVEEPRRGSWALRIAGAIVVAIGLGYGLAQGYKLVASNKPDGAPPVVRGDSAPSKTLPADPGGKQFAHTDAKILGRLGEGSPASAAAASPDSDVDTNGARKVQTVVVGRDGSITPPASSDEPVTSGAVAVPGLTVVDGFGGPRFPQADPTPVDQGTSQPQPAAVRKPVVVKPPAAESKPVAVATVAPPETSDSEPDVTPNAPEAPKKTAAVAPPSASSGANGYVVVLASVPASGDSRLSALRKFADMQQKYGAVLQNKTPDVQEANLGAKGTYHRLVVGPPGSRAQASTLCSDLKAAGYKDCWVMAY